MTADLPEPTDDGGKPYMDILLGQYSQMLKDHSVGDPACVDLETAMQAQRRRILYLEQEAG